MKKIFILIPLLFISCSGKNCSELPVVFSSYEKATEGVLNTDFKIEQEADVGGSSFLSSAEYFSCDGSTGYVIIVMKDQEYIFQGVPNEIWQGFRKAESKGEYYNQYLRGNFRLNLSSVSNEVIF